MRLFCNFVFLFVFGWLVGVVGGRVVVASLIFHRIGISPTGATRVLVGVAPVVGISRLEA